MWKTKEWMSLEMQEDGLLKAKNKINTDAHSTGQCNVKLFIGVTDRMKNTVIDDVGLLSADYEKILNAL